MSIIIKVFKDKGYFESKYAGKIDDVTLLASYKEFLESDEWFPTINELVDLSECDLREITSSGIIKLQRFAENHLIKNNVTSCKTAIYAPDAFSYGLANIYAAFAVDSSENTRHFREKAEAEKWLIDDVIH